MIEEKDCLIRSTLGVQPPGKNGAGAEEGAQGSGPVLLDFTASPTCAIFCILIFLPSFQERKGTAKSLLEELSKRGSNHSYFESLFSETINSIVQNS